MGEKQPFTKGRLSITDLGVDGQAGQLTAPLKERRLERERHQRRLYRRDLQSELPRDVIAEAGGANLRDRQATGGDHDRPALDLRVAKIDQVTVSACLD